MKNPSDKGKRSSSPSGKNSRYKQRPPAKRPASKKAAAKPTSPKRPARSAAAPRRRKTAHSGAGTPSRGWLRPLINWGGTLVLWGVLISGVILGYFAYTLPDISGINVIEKRPSLVFQTEKGVRFATYGDLYGNMLRPDEIPENMKNAVMAVEDSHFYDHFGVNPFSLVRAMWRNYQAGRVVEGGSTITQQLAKNLFLNPDRTLQRKIREVLLAFWLEANYSKDEILALYLNRMYFGSGTYGIDAAARKYFSKPARDLTIAEAAMLAGLLKAPTYYAPTANLDRAQQRSTVVIRRMEAEEFITPATANALVKAPATLRNAGSNFRNVRYFSDWVVSEVRSYIGRTEEDLIVRTTLDLDLQTNAEQSLESQLKTNSKKYNVSQAALITMTPTGAVKAMVGGRNYARSSFNRAVSAQRQPGSVFKTVVYTAGFEKGRAPDDVYMDGPVNIGGWKPHNYSRRYDGAMSLREAYSRSINTIAVKLTEDIGRGAVASTARKMGLTGKIPTHPSISLGTNEVSLVEMTSAYAVIANGGYGVLPYGVLEIKTASGKVLYQRHGSGLGRQLSARTVNHMRSIMTTAIQSGTGRNANPGFPAAGKTGTTQDYRDAWFIGFTPSLVTGVWFGNDDGSATKKVTGSNLPALAWRDFMKASTGASDRIAFAREKEPLSDSSIWQKIIQTFGSSSTPARSGSGTSNPVPGVPEYPTGATDRP